MNGQFNNADRVKDAADGLCRYGGEPVNTRLVDILEQLDDLNDNLANGYDKRFVLENIRYIKAELDAILEGVKS